MDFTEIYRQSSQLVAFSPGAHFILNAVADRLVARQHPHPDSSTHPPSHTPISHVAWSPDSEYILAASAKKGVVDVFKLRDDAWSARIEAGAEGLLNAIWAPDGRSVLCFSEWGLRVTVWSLTTASANYLQFPLHPDRAYAFRSDARYFILAERHKSKDTLGVYDTANAYNLVRHFPLPTSNLANLALSPTGDHLAVWEGILQYKLYILSLAGDIRASFSPHPEPAFGIRSAAWHPNGLFLAVGGWDDKIYILDSLTWSPAVTFELSSRIPSGATLWREPPNWLEATQGRGFLSYDKLPGPQSLSLLRVDPTKPHPKTGAVQLEWNITGSLLLVRYENVPTAVHIYEFPSPSSSASSATTPFNPRLRCVLSHTRAVQAAQWNPVRRGSLAMCCGAGCMYTWSDEWVGEGEGGDGGRMWRKEFEAREMKWAPDGKGVVLMDKDRFCCAFEVEEGEEGG
ncbi:hypothetical protein SERLA73DRAFT_118703 [Serpula lacrymans var. lacrymans S7.3]|uniref:Anaphase-promoting complex subunit 4 WD40 domain-containing protein n=1 Tax=Serpula lacrymans var. lacrymans (strain S7.3) TaxID=936435 RepID=F8PIB0_SERL3|nr:hypothetical protein SERLA73DRAFT_118703 [Serpula lacrymans var. lacrymans S7.3]